MSICSYVNIWSIETPSELQVTKESAFTWSHPQYLRLTQTNCIAMSRDIVTLESVSEDPRKA